MWITMEVHTTMPRPVSLAQSRHMPLSIKSVLIFLVVAFAIPVYGQYGNEWIDFEQTYYKFKVSEDGFYRIGKAEMDAAGLDDVSGADLRLYRLGEEVPIYTTTTGLFGSNDYIEFYGLKNRGELDKVLYEDPVNEQANPEYSMFTDTSTYFLTAAAGDGGLRLNSLANELPTGTEPEGYYMHEDLYLFHDESFDPYNHDDVSYASFRETEGYVSASRRARTIKLLASDYISDGPDANLEIRLITANLVAHQVNVLYRNDTLLRQDHSELALIGAEVDIAGSEIKSSSNLRFENLNSSGRLRVAFARWTYPREFLFDGDSLLTFDHPPSGEAQLMEFSGMKQGQGEAVLYDLGNNVRITTPSSAAMSFGLPAASNMQKIVMTSSEDEITYISSLTPVQYRNMEADDPELIIITHPSLTQGQNVVGQYADYRRSAEGGGYNVQVYNILDIYDQFGYGIEKHSQSIRNFAAMQRDKWSSAQGVLIIGKGLQYKWARTCEGDCPDWFKVPTYGIPGADNLLFAEPGELIPDIPVGRIPVIDQTELQVYLDKLKEYEQVPNLPQTVEAKGWTKRFLHLGGGQDAAQQNTIKNALNGMGDIIAASQYGAEATLFTKTSTNSVGGSSSGEILELLQKGVALIQFFGHSSGSTLDFQINEANEWGNKGKYPVFSAMGCSAGQIHSIYRSLSERFVFEPDAGAIAFIAGSGTQYLTPQRIWGPEWYTEVGRDDSTIGQTIIRSLRSYTNFNLLKYEVLQEQQTITGDPMIRLYPTPGADYIWDNTSVKFESDIITSSDEEYSLTVDFVNLGSSPANFMDIRIEQQLPSGEIELISEETYAVDGYRTELDLTLPMLENSTGLNRLLLTIDPDQKIYELPTPDAESNNQYVAVDGKLGIPLVIVDSRSIIVYPTEFSIVTEDRPILIASSTNALGDAQDYRVQLDTTHLFASPVSESLIRATGGVILWEPEIQFNSNQVYYWRVSLENPEDSLAAGWDTSSFLYLPGGDRGWNQSHYGQYNRDALTALDASEYQLKFGDGFKNVWIRNEGDFQEGDEPRLFIDSKLQAEFFGWFNNLEGDVFVVVMDSVTGTFWKNDISGSYGSINGISSAIRVFPFNTDSIQDRDNLMRMLDEVIPSGHYVMMYTFQRRTRTTYYPELWAMDSVTLGKNIFSVVESQHPESRIRSLANEARPYVLFYQKDVGAIAEGIAESVDETINVAHDFAFTASAGQMTSTLIGPSDNWDRLQWQLSHQDSFDAVSVRMLALSSDLTDTLVIQYDSAGIYFLDSLDAEEYSYLNLELSLADATDRSAAHLDNWRIHYEGMPDLMINSSDFVLQSDTINSGQQFSFSTAVLNASPYVVESVSAVLQVANEQSVLIDTTITIPALEPFAQHNVTLSTPLIGPQGEYRLIFSVNDDRSVEERVYFNNIGITQITLKEDKVNPLLSVTFDGRYISNYDFVSAEPVIDIVLTDDNAYVPLDDPSDIRVYLKLESDPSFTEILPGDPRRTFVGATVEDLPHNEAHVRFTPSLDPGIYDLQVLAKDKNDNRSGSQEGPGYQVRFEVKSAERFSGVKVYPTPARTYVVFDFTLSGLAAPDEMHIDIFGSNGMFIQDIAEGRPELYYIGAHKLIWDTTALPAGTYFYSISATMADGTKFTGDDSLKGKFTIVN